MLSFWAPVLLGSLVTASAVGSLCPLLGPDFPSPRNVSQNSCFRSAADSFSSTIQGLLNSGNSPFGQFNPSNNSFSINVFSTFSETPLYQYHYTAPLFSSNGTAGAKKVDGDTVFRIGSISKLFTVYTFLVERGDANFNDPVTKYVPELKNAPNNGVINSVQWSDVTLGALASQMSGIGRDYSGPSDLAWLGPDVVQSGLPPLNASDVPSCGIGIPGVPMCNRDTFFKGFLNHHPVFAPSTTPIYSNIAFQILAYALEGITTKTFDGMILNDVINPLHLSRTSTTHPNASVVAIPDGVDSTWNVELGDESPAGGMYSSSNDLAKLGRAILNSTLLSPAQTRRWMKPVTHTASWKMSVGAPWEIFRVDTPRGIVDVYTKSGSLGVYASLIVLIPDYDIGWAILSAADSASTAGLGQHILANSMADAFLPAIESTAKDEATFVFAGTYKATGGLNSSIVVVTDDKPGLGIQSWITNGTDVFPTYLELVGGTSSNSLSIRLYPTNLVQTSPVKERAFRAVFEVLPKPELKGAFSDCATWGGVDAVYYGDVSLDEFVFQFDQYGRAASLEPKILRVTLQKEV